MRATIDRKYGMGYVYLQDNIPNGGCAKSIEVQVDTNNPKGKLNLVIDLDKDGRVVGIEFFDAMNRFPQEVIDNAQELE